MSLGGLHSKIATSLGTDPLRQGMQQAGSSPTFRRNPTRVTSGLCQTSFEIIKLCSAWQDPEFMKDVEAATGVDLGSSRYSKKGKGKKKKHPNLTDLRERANTSRARLEKKVFAK